MTRKPKCHRCRHALVCANCGEPYAPNAPRAVRDGLARDA